MTDPIRKVVGADVQKSGLYLVGEVGPELFIPETDRPLTAETTRSTGMTFLKQYLAHRAKAFLGAAASGITLALLEAAERTFDFQLGAETKSLIVAAVTSQFVYWPSNGPKEGTS